MKQSVRPVLAAAVAFALLGLAPLAVPPAHASVQEIILNSSTVQIIHNPSPKTDVLSLSIDVTSKADGGSCDGGVDDLLESGVEIGVREPSCAMLGFALGFSVTYVEHDVGSASYGTFFLQIEQFSESSKIVALATPPGARDRWKINYQAAGLDLSAFTGNSIGLLVGDGDSDAGLSAFGTACFDVNVQNGNGITKPSRRAHSVLH